MSILHFLEGRTPGRPDLLPPQGRGSSREHPGTSGPNPASGDRKGRSSASLYDEIFVKEQQKKRKKRLHLLMIAAASVCLLSLILFVIPSEDSGPVVTISEPAPATPPEQGALAADEPAKMARSSDVETPAAPQKKIAPADRPIAEPSPAVAGSGESVVTQVRTEPDSRTEQPSGRQEPVRVKETPPEPRQEARAATPTAAAVAEEPDSIKEEVQETGPSEAALQAFDILQQKSDAARQLINGQLEDLAFREWKTVQEGADEIFIDLVAIRVSNGREVHFIWSVKTADGATRALSQAARDLEAATT